MAINLKFFADAALTQPLAGLPVSHDVSNPGAQQFGIYLGAQNAAFKYQRASNPGVDSIEVKIQGRLVLWSAAEALQVNTVRQIKEHEYQVISIAAGGLTGATEPQPAAYPVFGPDHLIIDNQITWQYQNKTVIAVENCKLALSLAGLATAAGGAALTLPPTILGGAVNAIPVFVELADIGAHGAHPVGSYSDISLKLFGVQEVPT